VKTIRPGSRKIAHLHLVSEEKLRITKIAFVKTAYIFHFLFTEAPFFPSLNGSRGVILHPYGEKIIHGWQCPLVA